MRVPSSHPDFDQLTLFLSRLTGQIDGRLIHWRERKGAQHRLTLTALRVLVVLSGDSSSTARRTQSSLADALGVGRSSLSPTIRSLESKGLVLVTRRQGERNHHVCITPAGRRAAHGAQVEVDDAIDDFMKAMDRKLQPPFFAAIRNTNETLERIASSKREEAYIDSLKRQDSKTRARGLKPMREILKAPGKLDG